MQRFHAKHGFTMLELMITVALMGIILSIAMPQLKGYMKREDARRAATDVATVLSQARSQAMSSGRMTFVMFGQPTNGIDPFEDGQIAAVVTDTDYDSHVTEADPVSPVFLPNGINSDISMYGVNGTPLGSLNIPDEDESRFVPTSDLASLPNGTTLPIDPVLGVPVIGFTPQGSPVRSDTPTDFGSGAGGVYLTDNDGMVLAVIVRPMGEIRTMVLDSGTERWR
jgi:prepilin-type N-terminal cleavage/methylation domain-containing protein